VRAAIGAVPGWARRIFSGHSLPQVVPAPSNINVRSPTIATATLQAFPYRYRAKEIQTPMGGRVSHFYVAVACL